MPLGDAVVLGIVQGITEFLPISSSGHLVLGKAALGVHTEGVAYEVFAHFGTFFAVLTVFWSDVAAMLRAAFTAISMPGAQAWQRAYQNDWAFRTLVLIVIGSIPAGVVGIAFESAIEEAFSSPLFVSLMLLVTGCLLLATRLASGRDRRFGWFRALLIGVAQSAAILPGISRSGSTIATALYLGVDREEAARFSFLLALPAILGAALLETMDLLANPIGSREALPLIVGFGTSYISGVLALKWLLSVIRRGKLDRFAYYCFAIGLLGIWIATRG